VKEDESRTERCAGLENDRYSRTSWSESAATWALGDASGSLESGKEARLTYSSYLEMKGKCGG
jgi:hypothetical protein